jgi:hypothetical protein
MISYRPRVNPQSPQFKSHPFFKPPNTNPPKKNSLALAGVRILFRPDPRVGGRGSWDRVPLERYGLPLGWLRSSSRLRTGNYRLASGIRSREGQEQGDGQAAAWLQGSGKADSLEAVMSSQGHRARQVVGKGMSGRQARGSAPRHGKVGSRKGGNG